MKKTRAFTLIELLVVNAFIASISMNNSAGLF